MVIFGTTVLLMLWLPVKVIQVALPGFLPYHVLLSSDAPVSELSLELLLLQVVLPALLEQGPTRTWLKNLVRGWCVATAWILNLRSYLLGDVPLEDQQPAPAANEYEPAAAADPEPQGLGEAHQAMMQPGGPVGFQPYIRPAYFVLRVCLDASSLFPWPMGYFYSVSCSSFFSLA
jgi:E3 ubiquitin-protein ligase MARCH6